MLAKKSLKNAGSMSIMIQGELNYLFNDGGNGGGVLAIGTGLYGANS